jgi:hypothetical protein
MMEPTMPDSSTERDPFAPIEASPRFATPLAVVAILCAVAAVVLRIEAIAGPVGMAVGLIAHVKGSRLGLPAAVLAGVGMIVGMTLTLYLR